MVRTFGFTVGRDGREDGVERRPDDVHFGVEAQVHHVRLGDDDFDDGAAELADAVLQVGHLAKHFEEIGIAFVGRRQSVVREIQLDLFRKSVSMHDSLFAFRMHSS